VLIAGITHASFLDVPFLSFADESRVAGGLAAVKIDPLRARRITYDYLLAFFAKHLLGADAPLLDASRPPYPEARLRAPKDLLAVDPHQAQQTGARAMRSRPQAGRDRLVARAAESWPGASDSRGSR
jgi:hypothetical protein